MTRNEHVIALRQQIQRTVQRFAEGQIDRYGFTDLDMMLAKVDSENAESKLLTVEALTPLIDVFWLGTELHCEAVRDLVSHLNLRSPDLAGHFLAALDRATGPSVRARYYFWMAFIAAGGELSPRRLEREQDLRQTFSSLWLDLAVHVYAAVPERLAALYTDEIKARRIAAVDVRRRIPMFVRLFGRKFPIIMKEILAALDPVDRLALAITADRYQPYDLAGWLTTGSSEQFPGQRMTYAALTDFEGYMGVHAEPRFGKEGVREFLDYIPRTGTRG